MPNDFTTLAYIARANELGYVFFPLWSIEVSPNSTNGFHQQKYTLGQIRRRSVLTHATLNLRPLRSVRPELRPLRPLCPEFHPLRPLRPVLPELPGNALSNSMRPEFPHNAGLHPMPPGPHCQLLCVRMGGAS